MIVEYKVQLVADVERDQRRRKLFVAAAVAALICVPSPPIRIYRALHHTSHHSTTGHTTHAPTSTTVDADGDADDTNNGG